MLPAKIGDTVDVVTTRPMVITDIAPTYWGTCIIWVQDSIGWIHQFEVRENDLYSSRKKVVPTSWRGITINRREEEEPNGTSETVS